MGPEGSTPILKPVGVFSRRFIAKPASPTPNETRAGASFRALSHNGDDLVFEDLAVLVIRGGASGIEPELLEESHDVLDRGAVWVCEAKSTIDSRDSPNFAFNRAVTASVSGRSKPRISAATIVRVFPLSSRRTRALAWIGRVTPSDGDRLAA